MEEEDDDSDSSKECERDSDDTQADVDRKVAEMLQNQQQYIQMCSSSSQLLQLLSRLVPGVTISGQMMKLDNISDESEDSAGESESAASAHSPATSDDNSGCVVWAEPVMTCQLSSSWKPYCNDVRRLPPGVRPEDLKNQNQSENRVSCDNCPASGAAGRRIKYPGVRKMCVPQFSNANTMSAVRDTSTQTAGKEKGSNPPAADGQQLENVNETNCVTTRAAFNDAMSKISNAADTIKRARNILAAVNTCRQENNNNNPETSGNGSSVDSKTSHSGHSNCNIDSSSHVQNSTDKNVVVENACGDNVEDLSAERSLQLQNEDNQQTNFPPPILVKAADVLEDATHPRSDCVEDLTSTAKEMSDLTADVTKNSQHSDHELSVFYDPTACVNGLSLKSSISRQGTLPSRHLNMARRQWCSRTTSSEYQTSRLVPQQSVNRQLYRYPYITTTSEFNKRTQQSVSLGTIHTENKFPPAPVNVPIIIKSTKPMSYETLLLDFSALDLPKNTNKEKTRNNITLNHFKIALQKATSNLKKQEAWRNCEKIMNAERSPRTRTTMSAFTISEVDSLHISPERLERDSMSSETVNAVFSDTVGKTTNSAEMNNVGDVTTSVADLTTEVETICYLQHRSPNLSSMEAEGTDTQYMLSSSEVEAKNDTFQTDSPSPRQTCKLSPSDNQLSDNTGEIPQIVGTLQSQPCCSHPPISAICKDMANSNCPQSVSKCENSAKLSDALHITVIKIRNEQEETEFKKEEMLNNTSATADSENNKLSINASPGEADMTTPVKHITAVRSNEDIAAGNTLSLLKCNVRKAKSAEESNNVREINGSTCQHILSSCNDDSKKPKGDNITHEIIATKGRDDFPPTFPEAGDTIVNLTKSDDVAHRIFGYNYHAALRNQLQGYFEAHAAASSGRCNQSKLSGAETDRKKRGSATNGKRDRHLNVKGNIDIQVGKSNNASLEKESSKDVTRSDDDKMFDGNLGPTGVYEVQAINTEEATGTPDDVVEININQDDKTAVIVLRADDEQRQFSNLLQQSSVNENQENIQSCSKNFKDKLLDSSATVLHQSNSKNPSFERTMTSRRHKEKVFDSNERSMNIEGNERSMTIDSNERSMTTRDVPVDIPPGGAALVRHSSRSVNRRFHRRRSRCSRSELKKEDKGKEDSRRTNIALQPNNKLISSDRHPKRPEKQHDITSQGYVNDCLLVPGTCTESILPVPNLKDMFPSRPGCIAKTSLSDMLDNETTGGYEKDVPIGTVISDSSKISLMDSAEANLDTVPSLLATAPSDTPVIDANKQSTPNGIKIRIKRFFAHCLHPFSNRS